MFVQFAVRVRLGVIDDRLWMQLPIGGFKLLKFFGN
jgi:hypothetical protein